MLKQENKRYIMVMISALLLSVFLGFAVIKAEGNADDFTVKPIYIFQNKAGRDPFTPRFEKENSFSISAVDITTLSIQGVSESNGIKTALFRTKSGIAFGYIFTEGKLYGDNDMEITDVNGEFKSDFEVMLRQGDREVLFRLPSEASDGPNIRPEQSANTTNNNAAAK
jgi:hypothetical protein